MNKAGKQIRLRVICYTFSVLVVLLATCCTFLQTTDAFDKNNKSVFDSETNDNKQINANSDKSDLQKNSTHTPVSQKDKDNSGEQTVEWEQIKEDGKSLGAEIAQDAKTKESKLEPVTAKDRIDIFDEQMQVLRKSPEIEKRIYKNEDPERIRKAVEVPELVNRLQRGKTVPAIQNAEKTGRQQKDKDKYESEEKQPVAPDKTKTWIGLSGKALGLITAVLGFLTAVLALVTVLLGIRLKIQRQRFDHNEGMLAQEQTAKRQLEKRLNETEEKNNKFETNVQHLANLFLTQPYKNIAICAVMLYFTENSTKIHEQCNVLKESLKDTSQLVTKPGAIKFYGGVAKILSDKCDRAEAALSDNVFGTLELVCSKFNASKMDSVKSLYFRLFKKSDTKHVKRNAIAGFAQYCAVLSETKPTPLDYKTQIKIVATMEGFMDYLINCESSNPDSIEIINLRYGRKAIITAIRLFDNPEMLGHLLRKSMSLVDKEPAHLVKNFGDIIENIDLATLKDPPLEDIEDWVKKTSHTIEQDENLSAEEKEKLKEYLSKCLCPRLEKHKPKSSTKPIKPAGDSHLPPPPDEQKKQL